MAMVKMSEMENSLADLEELKDVTGGPRFRRRRVAELSVKKIKRWLRLGMTVDINKYPRLAAFQERVVAESDGLLKLVTRHVK